MRTAVLIVVAAVLYFGPLFLDAPLTDPDEGLHAVIAQEMRERGDFVVPRFLGTAFLDKPILYFWAQAESIGTLGMSAAAARLPGMLFAVLGVASTGWLASVLFDSRTGVLAATCYATMALPFLLAQAPVHDMALVPFTNLALGWLWRGRPNREPATIAAITLRNLGLAGVALGLSILAKGLEGLAIVGVGYALYLLLERTVSWRVVAQGAAVVAIAGAIAAPWYFAMDAREPGYLHYYFVDRHLLGFATDSQRHGGQRWWFYLPLALGGGLPWILYVPGAVGKSLPGAQRQAGRLLWTWLLAGITLLTLSGSKAVTYVLPLMPAIAILAARTWSAAPATRDQVSGPPPWSRMAHALLLLAITVLTPWAASRFADQPVETLEVILFALLGAGWVWVIAAIRNRPAAYAWPRLVVATAATYAMAFALLGPPIAEAHSSHDLADYFNAAGKLPRTIYVMDQRVSFVYYLTPALRRQLRANQVRSVGIGELEALNPFPRDAVVALPIDLDERLRRVPGLATASRRASGRYLVVTP